jgi:FMN phosphatase YigB (HAD superfamily)
VPKYPVVPEGFDAVVFDLDGVLVENVWPMRSALGPLIPEGIEMLRHYADLGYTIIIDTARRKVDEDMIWEWVKRYDLPVDRVICGRKPMAGLYIDDRGYRFEREGGQHG